MSDNHYMGETARQIMGMLREPGKFATLEEVGRPRAAYLLHQFAMAAMPSMMHLHTKTWPTEMPDYDWISDQAYALARSMVEAGTRAEKEMEK